MPGPVQTSEATVDPKATYAIKGEVVLMLKMYLYTRPYAEVVNGVKALEELPQLPVVAVEAPKEE